MRKKIIELPRGYISYSQIMLWQSDKERYKKIYFDNRDEFRLTNKEMDYGKKVASALENKNETDDLLTDAAMLLLPKYDIRDQEIKVEMKTRDGHLTLLGRPDTMDSKTFHFREYKTGKTKWTAKKAQEHFQMKFYAMLIYVAHKKVLKDAYLDWIETEETPEGIKPTGKVESFRVIFSLNDILSTMALTTKVAKEIEVAFLSHIPDPNLKF